MLCEESSWDSAVRAPSVIKANFLIFTASFSSLSCPGPPVITPLIPRPYHPLSHRFALLQKAQFPPSFYSICVWASCIWIRICICICIRGLHFFCPPLRLFRKSSGNCDSQANLPHGGNLIVDLPLKFSYKAVHVPLFIESGYTVSVAVSIPLYKHEACTGFSRLISSRRRAWNQYYSVKSITEFISFSFSINMRLKWFSINVLRLNIKVMYAYLRSISRRILIEKVVIPSLVSFFNLFFRHLSTSKESYLYIKLY